MTTNNHDEIVLPDDPRSATLREDLKVWKSRRGGYFIEEEAARRDGATHVPCKDCGEPAPNHRGRCDPCKHKRYRENWLALPLDEEYDGGMICQYDGDRYFNSDEDAVYWCEGEGIDPADFMAVSVEPEYLKQFEYDDYYSDDLPDDTCLRDVVPEVAEAFDRLNELIGHKKHVLSFWPSGKRVMIERFPNADTGEQGVDHA